MISYLLMMMIPLANADQSALNLGDLPGFQSALEDADSPAASVGFRDLWGRPADFLGKRIHVEGTIQRRFRQGPIGEFPALVETWILDPSKNLICLVQPDHPEIPKLGHVEFAGTYLRTIRYRAGDADRLAPLVVGAGPLVLKPEVVSVASNIDRQVFEVGIALAAGLMAVIWIGRKMMNTPIARHDQFGPPPDFVS